MSRAPDREPRVRRALLAGAALAGLLAVEGAGRLLGVLPTRPSRAWLDLTNAVGPLPPPLSRDTNASPRDGFREELRFGALGFRGEATDFPPGNATRILALGDSYTAAWQVDVSERWPERLSALRERWATLNLGMPNWGTDQELLALRHYPFARPPQRVVLMFFPGNDVADNATLALTGSPPWHPYFVADGPRGDEPLRLREVAWKYRDPWDRPSELPFPRSIRAWLHLHSVAYASLGEIRQRLMRPAPPPAPPPSAVPRETGVFEPAKAADWELPWRITESLLLETKAEAARRGADLTVVLVPPYPSVQPELAPAYMRAEPARFDLALPARRLALFARRHDLALLDLAPGFAAYRRTRPGSPLFYMEDKHFTAEGHCVAAVLLAAALDPGRAPGDVDACASGPRAVSAGTPLRRP